MQEQPRDSRGRFGSWHSEWNKWAKDNLDPNMDPEVRGKIRQQGIADYYRSK